MTTYALAYDVGTTGVKTCLFAIDGSFRLVASAQKGYKLYLTDNGGAEQDENEWWEALCETTRALFRSANAAPGDVAGISFCSQMQGLVLVDRDGKAVRPPMSYMDQRARREQREGIASGFTVAGLNAAKLIKSLRITGAVASSVKDPVWKYKWVERNEPKNFARAYKWLDVKEYLIARCTDEFVMTEDSAFSTFLYDTRKGKEGWSAPLCRMCGVNMAHLPRVIQSTDIAGRLTGEAARALGLAAGTPVFGGGGDANLIGVGAGSVETGDTHVYCGTSGWVSTLLERRQVDLGAMIAGIVGVQRGTYNYFAEMETAGKCLEWVKDHLALDEIGVYLGQRHIAQGQEALYTSLYDYMTKTVENVPPGASGVLFAPWLHGNRCPFEDPNAAGMFFNIRLETGKTELIRAVLEGVCYHLRWMLECQGRKVKTSNPVRFVGGGALSDVTSRILADMTGKTVETVAYPQNAGAVGAAALVGVGLGAIKSIAEVKHLIPAEKTFRPDVAKKPAYDRSFAVFKELYRMNRNGFRALNALPEA
ncbi:MAG TPA: FGGY-family carbohydrate kinase [Clostridia bacterium]|nr:FGGY-family carbohydrate kinase [Clostridia bacterium]